MQPSAFFLGMRNEIHLVSPEFEAHQQLDERVFLWFCFAGLGSIKARSSNREFANEGNGCLEVTATEEAQAGSS
jgi:hypothetical protein